MKLKLILKTEASPSQKTTSLEFTKKASHWQAELPKFGTFVLSHKPQPDLPTHLIWELRYQADPGSSPLALVSITLQNLDLPPTETQAVANGIQCWTESPLLNSDETLFNESIPSRQIFGDHHILKSPETPGEIHSWSFSYSISAQRANPLLFAALDEDLFLSAFVFHFSKGTYDLFLDCERHVLKETGLLGAWILPLSSASNTNLPGISDQAKIWLNKVRSYERHPRCLSEPEQSLRRKPVRGYTSWYLHYNSITGEILRHNLAALQAAKTHMGAQDVFQIDDGYQRQVGDWLRFSKGFPNGVSTLAAEAKSHGMEAGIWIAPFIAVEGSDLLNDHPEWLLKNEQGQNVLCGTHPLWGGNFYALDTENEDFWNHLEVVLGTVLGDWGFSFIKADFLYATAVQAVGNLTRAQRSVRAHERLYKTILQHGGKLLSCGAVLSSAYMRCDYSRVGPDVGESWDNEEFGPVPSREKVSTRASLVNTFTRSPLSRLAFGNDPDVFLLRNHNTTLSPDERTLLCQVNFALGDLVFTSDDVARWDTFAISRYQAALDQGVREKILRVEKDAKGYYAAEYSQPEGNRRWLRAPLETGV